MARGWFDVSNPFWHWFSKLLDAGGLSLMFLAGCLPVVTVLPSCIALYDAVSRGLVNNAGGHYRRFLKTYWQELKRGIPMTILWELIMLVILYSHTIIRAGAETDPHLVYMFPVFLVLFLLYFAILSWLIPLESRYFHRFFQLHGNAMRLTVARLGHTAGNLVVLILGVGLCIWLPVLLIVMPALIAAGQCFFVEKVFRKQFLQDEEEVFPPGFPQRGN